MTATRNVVSGPTSRQERKSPTYPLEQILPLIVDPSPENRNPKVNLDGDVVKVGSLRLRTFRHHGTTCVFCGLTATFFAKERPRPDYPWHLNLYGVTPGGHEVVFTKDHRVPRSKGGKDHLSNMQTACSVCNQEKGNNSPEEE